MELIDREKVIAEILDYFEQNQADIPEADRHGRELESYIRGIPAQRQKMPKRKGRDAWGRLIVGKWHLEVTDAEIADTDVIPEIISLDVGGHDYRGDYFCTVVKSKFSTE